MSGKTALVLGGGGSKGAVQAGFLRAVEKLDISVDLIVAASVGAINGAFFAAGMPARRMIEEWARVRRRELFGFNWSLLWRWKRASSIFTPDRLRSYLEARLPVRRFRDLPVPLIIITTDLNTGEPYLWESGDLVDAILASTAVPGLLPPREAPDGRLLIDGALSDNVPVETAFERGADRVLGILCRTCAACQPRDLGLVNMLGQAFGIAVDCKWRADMRRYDTRDDVLIIKPELGREVPTLDFTHGRSLCLAGYGIARAALGAWLGTGRSGTAAGEEAIAPATEP